MTQIKKILLIFFLAFILSACSNYKEVNKTMLTQEKLQCTKNELKKDSYLGCLEKKILKTQDTITLNELADIYVLKEEYEKAITYYKLGASKNSFYSMYSLGTLYKDILKNDSFALKWFEKASFLPYKDSTCLSATLYKNIEKQKEINYLNKELKRGNVKANNCIAFKFLALNKYKDGNKWFLKASLKNDLEAKYYLSYLNIKFFKNEFKAKEYYLSLLKSKKTINYKCLNYQDIIYLRHKDDCLEYLVNED